MKNIITLIIFCVLAFSCSQDASINKKKAKPAPEWVTNGIIYQVQPRAFTSEGTLKAATKKLSHIADLGATIVYICPVFVADDNEDTSTWSARQKASKMNNPRNPYRIKDYFHVDPEYGTDDDLKEFIDRAHDLGLKVMLDLVYFHCGMNAVFLEEHPDFIKRDENGDPLLAGWSWPMLDFDNPELREYLYQNMEYWVKDFNVDGFRLDLACHGLKKQVDIKGFFTDYNPDDVLIDPACPDVLPLDFWETARRRIEKINPDVAMLAECAEIERPEDQIKALDLNYGYLWYHALKDVFDNNNPAVNLRNTWTAIVNAAPKGARFTRYFDNHDIANDDWYKRREERWGFAACQAIFVNFFTLDGVPFIYNGQEIADTARHSIFGRSPIHWENAGSLAGKMRFDFLKKLCEMRKNEPALINGELIWLDNDKPEAVLSYMRIFGGDEIMTVINLTNNPVRVNLQNAGNIKGKSFQTLLEKDIEGNPVDGFEINDYGFWIGKRIKN
jgi:cyclomaltodextrinase